MPENSVAPMKPQIEERLRFCERLVTNAECRMLASLAAAGEIPGKETPLAMYIKLSQLLMDWHAQHLRLLKEEEKLQENTAQEESAPLRPGDWELIRQALRQHDAAGEG